MRTTNTILDEIVRRKQSDLPARIRELPLDKIRRDIEHMPFVRRDFGRALKNPSRVALIAEIKKASPSEGVIKPDFDHVAIARAYESADIDAISVLTEENYFRGRPYFVRDVRKVTSAPILRKDFVIDPYQIYESKWLGADAILLITSILSVSEMSDCLQIARGLGLDCLVETHNAAEVQQALSCGARIIGVNNRDLATFRVDVETFVRLAPTIPKDRTIVCESAISTREDVLKAARHGADAVLVGTGIMRAPNPAEKILQLKVNRPRATKIKICGMTSKSDALAAAGFGADILGFVFFEGSPRNVAPREAKEIIANVKSRFPNVRAAGVFVNATQKQALQTIEQTGIDMVQIHGDNAASLAAELRRDTSVETILAVQVKDRVPLESTSAGSGDYILFDRFHETQYGGTGKSIPVDLLKACMGAAGDKHVFVAGGIGEENIDAVLALKPYGVDINSKVEIRPGVKDHEKMKRIITRIREGQV